ncbi:hypothetical protein AB1Y20_010878 [Prymnesium parvum]|uniref:Retroviral polymerase SH3-like domain-containing protein n=1 Tax=Prymnesium parvum TaxID=97485 RepID=A0AB34ITB8_PRYPA
MYASLLYLSLLFTGAQAMDNPNQRTDYDELKGIQVWNGHLADKPDIMAAALAFYPEWCSRIHKGNRRCLTSEIGNNPPEEKLKEIRYPDGITRPCATIHCVNDKSLFEAIDENKDEIKENLISVGRLWDDTKIQCTFGSECMLHDTINGFKFEATRDEKRHYRVALTEGSTPSPFAWTLHNRLGHCSVRRIKLLYENTIGVDTSSVSTLRENAFHDCAACRAGKSAKKPVQTDDERNKTKQRSTNSEGISDQPKAMEKFMQEYKHFLPTDMIVTWHTDNVLTGNKTPFESLHGTKPDISKIRVWGCLVWYVLEDRDRDSKIAPRAVPAVHLGRDHQRKGYHIYVPSLNRVTTGYHLTFQEKKFISFDNQKNEMKKKKRNATNAHESFATI